MQCYRCHSYSHVDAQCSSKNLLIEGVDLDDDFEIYEPVGSVVIPMRT